MILSQATALRLLREAVRRSGLSAQSYARKILIREPRTLRRWLAGDSPIPHSVCDFLTTDKRTNPNPPGG